MTKSLKLISLGSRGVGKTVFLVSNCATALQDSHQDSGDTQWFECRDQQSKDMVTKLLAYVNQNQTYPPATFKISDFNLSFKEKSLGRIKTLCDIQWVDIPGEWCTLDNADFQSALLESHGCCIFIDADALLNQETYFKSLEQTIQQIDAIISLINQNNLIQYPIALICTKYDLIQADSIGLIRLEEKLKPLIQKIESSQGIYKRFYSGIALTQETNGLHQTTNANEALRWMTTTLNAIHTSDEPRNLGEVLKSIVQDKSVARDSDASLPEAAVSDAPLSSKGVLNQKKALNLALVVCGAIAGLAALFLLVLPKSDGPGVTAAIARRVEGFQKVLENDPENKDAIAGIVKVYAEDLGDQDQAIMELNNLHAQSPDNLFILKSLADLYELKGETAKQEEFYDKILALDKINLDALQGKVKIKVENGNPNEAREILKRAEKNARTPAYKALLQNLSQQIPTQ